MNNTKQMLLRGLTVGAGCFMGSVIYNSLYGQSGRGFAIGLIAFAIVFGIYGVRAIFVDDGFSRKRVDVQKSKD